MTKASTQPLKYISDFMKKNCSDEIIDTWNNDFKDGFIKLIEKGATKKAKKSADAPKGHRSAYILFCMEDRPKVNEEFPDLTSQEKVSLMSQRWKIAKEDPKLLEYYNDLAAKDRERAAAEKEAYNPTTEDDDADVEDKVVEKKKTKRTKTGYQLFCQENRESVKEDGYTGKEITEELNKRWKTLKEEDEDLYAEYMEKAADLKKSSSEEETPAPKKVAKKTKKNDEEKPAAKTKKIPTKAKNKVAKKILVEDDDEDLVEED